ncbi:DgyrCDS10528 [Dimorphilus gyrociliatus]|nr:DgyrCDS10528 [Dimorphilus gyrociliatus]
MYGMTFSLKSFCNRISPTDPNIGFTSFKTSQYKLHFYETPSGLKFIMTTDLQIQGDIRFLMHTLYKDVFVEYAIRDPECELNKPIKSKLFSEKLNEFIQKQPQFGNIAQTALSSIVK